MAFDVSLSLNLERAARSVRKDAVADDYALGIPVNELARKYGMSPAYVVKIARERGLTRYTARRGTGLIETVVARYRDGVPVATICADCGVDRKSVWTWVRAAGVELRRPRLQEGADNE